MVHIFPVLSLLLPFLFLICQWFPHLQFSAQQLPLIVSNYASFDFWFMHTAHRRLAIRMHSPPWCWKNESNCKDIALSWAFQIIYWEANAAARQISQSENRNRPKRIDYRGQKHPWTLSSNYFINTWILMDAKLIWAHPHTPRTSPLLSLLISIAINYLVWWILIESRALFASIWSSIKNRWTEFKGTESLAAIKINNLFVARTYTYCLRSWVKESECERNVACIKGKWHKKASC